MIVDIATGDESDDLRIERTGTGWRFVIGGVVVYESNTNAPSDSVSILPAALSTPIITSNFAYIRVSKLYLSVR